MDKVAKDREEKAFRFTTFCVRSLKMGLEDGQIATEMGFQSAGMLYKELELDGSPVCGICGMLYPGPDHREEDETGKSKRKQRQPGVGGGHRVRLPDASGALGLFRHAVQSLEEYISIVASEESWQAT